MLCGRDLIVCAGAQAGCLAPLGARAGALHPAAGRADGFLKAFREKPELQIFAKRA